jgi:hypothetical protein
VTISCLINQISDLPPEHRRIPLATIAERTKLSIDGVEFLLMKALALHLIEGSIDQVSGVWGMAADMQTRGCQGSRAGPLGCQHLECTC